MIRLFSIVHLRTLLLTSLGGTVVIAVALRLLLRGWDQGPGAVWLLSLGLPAAVLLVVLLVLATTTRPQEHLREMERMLAGQGWAHWHYDEDAWRAANGVESRRDRRDSYTAALLALAVGLVAAVIGLVAGVDLFVFAGVLSAGMALVALAAVATAGTALPARGSPRGEIHISPLGVYRRPGGYVALRSLGTRLCGVDLVEAAGGDPAVLRFTAMVQGRGGAVPTRLADVAVPPGREDEARALVRRFHDEVLRTD
ncbi:hypothetical protein [Planomonospora alba]|uniref:hypothetical protein n=1 Tax=Planomonospora alba TaxID=161354 RepID=UPI0031E77396